ncbi:DUF6708 domain-containing protein [Pseudomonas sp. FYR_7]|uniref:DUF6708 domain-containing protein n=1 Tax=Pseudomonas sp. FYR_7 TaxID=3367174 RepID=UPI00370BA913
MYLFEWGFHWSKSQKSYEEIAEEAKNQQRQPGQPVLNAPESVQESVSKSVYDNESLYAYNNTHIDVRTPNDEKRGLITLSIGSAAAILLCMLFGLIWIIIQFAVTGHAKNGEPVGAFDFTVLSFALLIPISALYIYYKYAFRYIFLEAFTARRLIIRFNRITRKVYLLRPNLIGGTRIMDWDKTQIIVEKNMTELEGTGGFVWLSWDKGDGTDLEGNPTDDIEVAFVGKPTRNASELLAFWEYIRRYMEDGPAAAPAPEKLIPKFPWPWLSLKAAWGLDTRFLRNSALWVFVLLNILMLPLILIHAFGHWLSLLLCYEPRFPRAIEEAGRASASAET